MVTPLAPEIIWFTPSKSYLTNPSDTLRAVSKPPGDYDLLGTYYGFDEDDPSIGVWVMAWHTLAAHQSFMERETYVDFALSAMEAMVGFGDISQILLSKHSDFPKAVSSPVTQFIYLTVRPRHDRAYELVPLIERLAKELTVVQGCYGSSWGPSIEYGDVYVGVVGWRSRADRERATMGVLASTVSLIREIATIELKYARLRLHEFRS